MGLSNNPHVVKEIVQDKLPEQNLHKVRVVASGNICTIPISCMQPGKHMLQCRRGMQSLDVKG